MAQFCRKWSNLVNTKLEPQNQASSAQQQQQRPLHQKVKYSFYDQASFVLMEAIF